MDHAGCHPKELAANFSNIKICFLPANHLKTATFRSWNYKVHYRKLLLSYVISKIDECSSASEVVKSVSILAAIRQVEIAWSKVKEETILKWFRRAGVLDNSLDVVTHLAEKMLTCL